MAAKAGPHPHHSCGQAPHSHSVSHNSQYQQPPSHTKHTQHLLDTSSAEDHQQHSGRPILSKDNPHIPPFTQHPSDISSAEHDQQHSGRPVLSKDNPHIPPFTHTPQTSAGIASPQCPNLHQNLPAPQSTLSQASQHRPSHSIEGKTPLNWS